MFNIDTFHQQGDSVEELIEPATHFMNQHDASLILCFATPDVVDNLSQWDIKTNNKNRYIAVSSCLGSATEKKLSLENQSVSLFCIEDKHGHYGVAQCEKSHNLRANASETVLRAINNADRMGIAPKMIWCFQTPGNEEEVLQGIQDAVGTRIPIFGGSCADNDLTGQWQFATQTDTYKQGFVVAVLYPSVETSGFYSSGYDKTPLGGIVTNVKGRTLNTIDNHPAMDVYNHWREQLGFAVLADGNILSESTSAPLARSLPSSDNIPRLLLSHPAKASKGSIELFSTLNEGDSVSLVSGTKKQLVKRAEMVIASLLKQAAYGSIKSIEGVIIIFCGGCMLSIQEAMQEVQSSLSAQLPGIPYIMGFTFGEFGSFDDSTSRFGNLMITCEIFGSR